MILANSTWGGWLAQLGVPGIYRSQASLAPGVKVRMGTKPAPHAGMGVAQYVWATSPLRRYVDLVNQWQLISCVRHGRMAALAAPFKPKDATLFAIISNFDTAYSAYNDFQRGIERYWTLRWLEQQGVQEVDAVVIKPGWVRADEIPLVLAAAGTESLARGTPVRVRMSGTDLMTLDAYASLVAQLQATSSGSAVEEESLDAADEGHIESAAGPISLAIDLAEGSDAETEPHTSHAPPATAV
jgi:exoribonuclease-2